MFFTLIILLKLAGRNCIGDLQQGQLAVGPCILCTSIYMCEADFHCRYTVIYGSSKSCMQWQIVTWTIKSSIVSPLTLYLLEQRYTETQRTEAGRQQEENLCRRELDLLMPDLENRCVHGSEQSQLCKCKK